MNVDTIIIRRSPIMAVCRLMVILIALSIIFGVVFFFIENSIDSGEPLLILHIETIAVFAILCILITFFIMLQWAFEVFYVQDGRMTHRRGVVFRKMENISLRNVEEIATEEGFFGRLMKHGTIVMHNPLMKKPIKLTSIMDPLLQARSLRGAIGEKDADKIVPLPASAA